MEYGFKSFVFGEVSILFYSNNKVWLFDEWIEIPKEDRPCDCGCEDWELLPHGSD